MKAYWQARAEGEEILGKSGLTATIVRPWYVLGPGHRWPCLLLPAYWILERLPPTREAASRLGLVTLAQMARALIFSVQNPPRTLRVLEVPEIRRASIEPA